MPLSDAAARVASIDDEFHKLDRPLVRRLHRRRLQELEKAREAAVDEAIKENTLGALDTWFNSEPPPPAWCLPPRHWVAQHVQHQLPNLFRSRIDVNDAFDQYARTLMESREPTPPPFAPWHKERTQDDHLVKRLKEHEDKVLQLLKPEHLESIHHWIHENRSNPTFLTLLSSESLLFRFNPKDVVWRVQCLRYQDTHPADSYRHDRWVTEKHRELTAGACVKFQFPISATTKSYHFGSICPEPPDLWRANEWVRRPSSLRLELRPLLGFYIGERTAEAADSHLRESEVVIPPGGRWRCRGIRDLRFANRAHHVEQRIRMETVLLEQVESEDEGRFKWMDKAPEVSYS